MSERKTYYVVNTEKGKLEGRFGWRSEVRREFPEIEKDPKLECFNITHPKCPAWVLELAHKNGDCKDPHTWPARVKNPEIQKMLVVSTCHAKRSDIELLGSKDCPYVSVENGEYGYFVNTAHTCETAGDARRAGFSQEFLTLMATARSLSCQWLNLDRDGDVLSGLATFDW